jgi:hypothetical protein
VVAGSAADHDHRVDDVAAEHSPASDAALLASLHGRHGSVWHLALALMWAVSGVAQLGLGHVALGVVWELLALAWGARWWVGPQPSLRELTDDTLRLRKGIFETREIARSDVTDVQASYGSGYGLVLALRGADSVTLAGTAPRHSVAAAQAAALRRWAALEQ